MRKRARKSYDPPMPEGLTVSPGGEPVQVLELLGEGGQGVVYRASHDGREWALKLYRPETASVVQRRIIERLVKKGPPPQTASFLWPLRLVEQEGGCFGYLMDLREPRFLPCEDFLARRVSSTFESLITAAWQLAGSFRSLHIAGLAYSDISFGNVFFDPGTGDVRICDNDNIDVDGAESSGVLGTPRFMAPEIVRGEARPSSDTDRFSLAVLLFYLLLGGHPLDGAREAAIRSLDGIAMRRLYGETPLYIFDPQDGSNAPVPSIHDNPITFRPLYPRSLLDLFERSFTAGLHAPRKRVMESEWMKALLRARDILQRCPACDKQSFAGPGRRCWGPRCQRPVPPPLLLELERDWRVVLQPGKLLYPHHIDASREGELDPVLAQVTTHPQDPSRLGLRNAGQEPWVLTRPDGTRDEVPPGRSAPLLPGNRLQLLHGRSALVVAAASP